MKAIFKGAALAALVSLAHPAIAQDKLVAIDVLLEPDQKMLAAAEDWNKRLREQMPEGFALDETHRPHITLLQQYVAEKDLDASLATIKSLAASEDLSKLKLTANGLYHIPSGKIGLQGITIEPSSEIVALQAKVIQAMAPFRKSGGGQEAFVPDPTGTPFDPVLFKYVESFPESQAGKKFNPHVTTGTAPLEWVQAREKEPFEPFEFGVDKLTVYKLGNFGTAAKRIGD
ncbi:MAG: 2'-5' RNA ligase family protein [Hyphomicrobiaceae bacterium]